MLKLTGQRLTDFGFDVKSVSSVILKILIILSKKVYVCLRLPCLPSENHEVTLKRFTGAANA